MSVHRRPYWSKWVGLGLRLLADPTLFPLPSDPDEARAIAAARRFIERMTAWREHKRKEAKRVRDSQKA